MLPTNGQRAETINGSRKIAASVCFLTKEFGLDISVE